jgi:hypothetical protein
MRPLIFLPIVVGVVVVPIASCDHFLMMCPMMLSSFLFVFFGVPLSVFFFPLLGSAFGTRFAFGARMTCSLVIGMCLLRRRIGICHRVEDRTAGRAQTRLIGRHASRHPWDVRNFIGAQTKGVRLARFTLLIGHFEGMRREARAKAEEGRQHDESRSISNSAAFHNKSPQAQQIASL